MMQTNNILFEMCRYFLPLLRIMKVNYLKKQWKPREIFDVDAEIEENYAIVVLNRKIKLNQNIVEKLWQNATLRITIDGGTNRWLSFLDNVCKRKDMNLPDFITGDFDSITERSLKYFSSSKINKIHTPCQDETDFTKALKAVKPDFMSKGIKKIIVLQETCGRLDHLMANINTLFKSVNILGHIEIYLLSSNSLTWLLEPGEHAIVIPEYLVQNRGWCSLIPIGEKVTVTTKGLKWDLDKGQLEFGKLVSTSNTYSSQVLNIVNDKHLLWSMGIFNFSDSDDE